MAVGAHATKLLNKLSTAKNIETALTQKEMDFLLDKHPEALNKAFNAYNKRNTTSRPARDLNNKATTTTAAQKTAAQKKAAAAIAKMRADKKKTPTVRKPKDKVVGQRDATEIGEEAAKKAGKGTPNAKPKVRGGGANKNKPKTPAPKPKTAAETAKRNARTAAFKQKRANDKNAAQVKADEQKRRELAVIANQKRAARKQEVENNAKAESKALKVAGNKNLTGYEKILGKGKGSNNKGKLTGMQKIMGAGVGAAAVAAGLSGNGKKAETPAKTNKKAKTTTKATTTKPPVRKGGSNATTAAQRKKAVEGAGYKLKEKKKNYGESGMGMKAYQNLNFNRRK